MEPISAALLAFAAIKKGISLGKDLSAMSKDVSNLFAFIDGTKEAQKGVATFKRMREQSASRDRESKYAAVARKNKILNILSILAGISITVGGGSALIWAAIEYKP